LNGILIARLSCIFLPLLGYTPVTAAREFGSQVFTPIFTYGEVGADVAGLSLSLIADDSAHDYEKQDLPEAAWSPSGWYAEWVRGFDVFDMARHKAPIALRWLDDLRMADRPGLSLRIDFREPAW